MNSVCHFFLKINIQHPFNNLVERVEIIPEHPWAGVSSESWTSSGCPSLPVWRPHPRPPGCRVCSSWTEQSGRSGCSETAPLQKGNQERGGSAKSQSTRKRTNKRLRDCWRFISIPLMKAEELPGLLLVFCFLSHHVGFSGSDLCNGRHFLYPQLDCVHCSALRIIPLLDKRGIISLNPLPRHAHDITVDNPFFHAESFPFVFLFFS